VTALSVGGEDDDGDLDEFVDYLAWHGIAAGRQTVKTRSHVGDVLLDAAADADLMVMGAYSHSRLRELILGGVTRHMLEKATLPLLVAH
jgi:nucleotide-binding universal stress UspA family protein